MSVYQHIASNKRKSFAIVLGFLAFTGLSVYVLMRAFGYGLEAMGFALIVSGISSFVGYWYSDKVILTMSGARPADRERDFMFYTVAENLSLVSRLPMPKLYVIEDTAMNAFATGRDPEHAVVVATTGLLDRLDRSELEGVIAHEFSHIQNYDIRLMSVVAVLVGLIALLADFFLRFGGMGGRSRDDNEKNGAQAFFIVAGVVLALLSPIIAQLIQLAVSRSREYLADASAAKLTRQPSALASALAKLDHDHEPLEAANKATAHLYITNPLKNQHSAVGWFAGLFMTHPPISERISRLKSM